MSATSFDDRRDSGAQAGAREAEPRQLSSPGDPPHGAQHRTGSAALRPLARGSLRLTAPAAILLALGLAVLGRLFDAATGGLVHAGPVLFVAGFAVAAAKVRFDGLGAVLVAPPLIYAGLAFAGTLAIDNGLPRTLSRQLVQVLTELVIHAPVLFVAVVVTMVVAGVRLLQR